jgi:hypothetical protein
MTVEEATMTPTTAASNRRESEDPVRWSAFPSWKHFVWLYMFSAMAGIRGLILLRSATSGWEFWFVGAALLLVCAVALRRWAVYVLTSRRLIMMNGYTGREIQALPVNQIADITIEQGWVARTLDIGTVVLRAHTGDQDFSLRGVPEPEVLKVRVNALRTPSERQSEGMFLKSS